MKPLALALLVLLSSGCLKVGNDSDLHLVCERKVTSPWHPYSPDDLARTTTVLTAGRNVSAAEKRALLTAAADATLTLGGAPYREFDATLSPYYEPAWSYHAWGNGTSENASAEDEYLVRIDLGAASATLEEPVRAPATIRDLASVAVARTSETADVARTKTLAAATWDGELPGCVSMEYQPTPAPCPPTVPNCPHPTMSPSDVSTVTVNVDKGVVVSRVDGRASAS